MDFNGTDENPFMTAVSGGKSKTGLLGGMAQPPSSFGTGAGAKMPWDDRTTTSNTTLGTTSADGSTPWSMPGDRPAMPAAAAPGAAGGNMWQPPLGAAGGNMSPPPGVPPPGIPGQAGAAMPPPMPLMNGEAGAAGGNMWQPPAPDYSTAGGIMANPPPPSAGGSLSSAGQAPMMATNMATPNQPQGFAGLLGGLAPQAGGLGSNTVGGPAIGLAQMLAAKSPYNIR